MFWPMLCHSYSGIDDLAVIVVVVDLQTDRNEFIRSARDCLFLFLWDSFHFLLGIAVCQRCNYNDNNDYHYYYYKYYDLLYSR